MTSEKPTEEAQSTLLRSVRVLFGLAEAGRPMTVTPLANLLGLPASTTHRILNVLRQGGYVAQDAQDGTYAPGPGFLRIAMMMAATRDYPAAVGAALQGLVDDCGESAFYGVYLHESQRLKFAATLHSHHAIQYVLRKDQTYSLLWGASGHAIASQLPEATLQGIYDREKDSREGIAAIPDWENFLRQMQGIRQNGHAISEGARHDGSHAIAAPVLGPDDSLIGCIGIAMPTARRETRKTGRCVALVTAAARHLSLAAQAARPHGDSPASH